MGIPADITNSLLSAAVKDQLQLSYIANCAQWNAGPAAAATATLNQFSNHCLSPTSIRHPNERHDIALG